MAKPVAVTDFRSNLNDQIVNAAELIGRSEQRAAVFDAVCTGKQRVKTRDEVAASTGLPPKRVLEVGKQLADRNLIHQTTKNGQTAWEKDGQLSPYKTKILRLARDPVARAKVPTKIRPRTTGSGLETVTLSLPSKLVDIQRISVDDIDSFERVRDNPGHQTRLELPEESFKLGVQSIIGEPGKFKDWGGEANDLYTTRLKIFGRREAAAFAFKGPGQTGRLTPKKMGTNGDQIQRLFQADATVFVVHYWREIDESVIEQMKHFAISKSVMEGRKVFYGVIDGRDACRIFEAYEEFFQGG
jgi:hypothetical protein